jgi:prophage tail gpP-like protein
VKNPNEIAGIEVNGRLFHDWTSVMVEARYADWYPIFSFECTEDSPVPIDWRALQFAPGDVVKVTLAAQPAVHGYVTERHVGYDKRNHGVRIIGCGKTIDLPTSSVPLEKTGNHDGKSWPQLAQDLMSHLGIPLEMRGAVDATPFEQIQVQPGETIASAQERYARMRKIVIGSSPNGALIAIGDHSAQTSGYLTEGENILSANCVIRDLNVYKKIYALGQQNGNDDHNMDQANKQIAQVGGTSARNRYLIVPADIADTPHGIQQRAEMEKVFTEGSQIEAHITVQGWLKSSGQLWKAGEYYWVKSPMLILNRLLGCKVCTYEQDNARGTITTLQMVDPVHMNGKPDMRGPPPT